MTAALALISSRRDDSSIAAKDETSSAPARTRLPGSGSWPPLRFEEARCVL